jgi:hypothetical protein
LNEPADAVSVVIRIRPLARPLAIQFFEPATQQSATRNCKIGILGSLSVHCRLALFPIVLFLNEPADAVSVVIRIRPLAIQLFERAAAGRRNNLQHATIRQNKVEFRPK